MGRPISLACGALHNLLVDELHQLWSLGWGATGVLAHGDRLYHIQACRVAALEGRRIVSCAGGAKHTIVVEGVAGASGLTRDLDRLHQSAAAADCVLLVGRGRPIRFDVHAAILAARCPRLLAMLALNDRFCQSAHPALRRAATTQRPLPPETGHAPLRLPWVRSAVMSLLLEWIYTDNYSASDRLFETELGAISAKLRLPGAPLPTVTPLHRHMRYMRY